MTFGADENAPDPTSDISALIHIVDDDKDEANIQYFIVALEIVDAVNMDLIHIDRASSQCVIIDDDGWYLN